MSHEDELTGLANRRSWEQALGRAFARARRAGGPLAVLLCDLDHFKQVNDTHGHQAGDQVLRETAALLASRVRGGDLVARLGGDEFAVLCADLALPDAITLGDALVEQTKALRCAPAASTPVSLSVGVATLKAADRTPADLIARADRHLYQAKRQRGRACGTRTPAHLA